VDSRDENSEKAGVSGEGIGMQTTTYFIMQELDLQGSI
jgi:hypothetical protein